MKKGRKEPRDPLNLRPLRMNISPTPILRWLSKRLSRAILLVLVVSASVTGAGQVPPISENIAGGEFEYAVQKGDSLTSIGARFGVDAAVLARDNSLKSNTRLKINQALRVQNRHIVPQYLGSGIVINVPQRMLFYFEEGRLVKQYPVGLGRPDWPTPEGDFKIISKEEDPTWDVPDSIQEEMRRQGKEVTTKVLPGPDNPLGKYWLGLSLLYYGIHGTNAPASIYHFQTHGCIRLHPDDIADLFSRVFVGTPGKIIYEPLLLARMDEDRIYMEVHRDIYKKGQDLLKMLRSLVFLYESVGRQEVEHVVRMKDGIAREVTPRKTPEGAARGRNTMKALEDSESPLAEQRLNRRTFLKLGAFLAIARVSPAIAMEQIRSVFDREKSLAFYNTHTGENLNTVYWAKGDYVPEGLTEINRILRDHRTDQTISMDLRLLDLLVAISTKLETHEPFHVISGYRSFSTNAALYRSNSGVARHSLHVDGKAVDIRVPGRDLPLLRRVALVLGGGGVGYYPQSNFVHVDVGRVRTW